MSRQPKQPAELREFHKAEIERLVREKVEQYVGLLWGDTGKVARAIHYSDHIDLDKAPDDDLITTIVAAIGKDLKYCNTDPDMDGRTTSLFEQGVRDVYQHL